VGKIYSKLICGIYKSVALANPLALEGLGLGEAEILELRALQTLSDYDEFALRHFHGSSFGHSAENYYKALSGGGDDTPVTTVPMLQIQPADDPLHQNRVRLHLAPEELVAKHPRAVFLLTCYGNHFGFYEEGILRAMTSKKTYTYPARVARAFFDQVDRED